MLATRPDNFFEIRSIEIDSGKKEIYNQTIDKNVSNKSKTERDNTQKQHKKERVEIDPKTGLHIPTLRATSLIPNLSLIYADTAPREVWRPQIEQWIKTYGQIRLRDIENAVEASDNINGKYILHLSQLCEESYDETNTSSPKTNFQNGPVIEVTTDYNLKSKLSEITAVSNNSLNPGPNSVFSSSQDSYFPQCDITIVASKSSPSLFPYDEKIKVQDGSVNEIVKVSELKTNASQSTTFNKQQPKPGPNSAFYSTQDSSSPQFDTTMVTSARSSPSFPYTFPPSPHKKIKVAEELVNEISEESDLKYKSIKHITATNPTSNNNSKSTFCTTQDSISSQLNTSIATSPKISSISHLPPLSSSILSKHERKDKFKNFPVYSKRRCISCGSDQSPCWRPSWSASAGQLCNSCGLRYKKTGARCTEPDCGRIPAKGEWAAMCSSATFNPLSGRMEYVCIYCHGAVEVNERS